MVRVQPGVKEGLSVEGQSVQGQSVEAPADGMASPRAETDGSASLQVLRSGAELVLRGRLDAHSVAVMREALHRAVDAGEGDLVLRLGAAEIVDATGLGVIVGVHRRARLAGRRLVLLEVPERLERLIRFTRLHPVLVRSSGTSWVRAGTGRADLGQVPDSSAGPGLTSDPTEAGRRGTP